MLTTVKIRLTSNKNKICTFVIVQISPEIPGLNKNEDTVAAVQISSIQGAIPCTVYKVL